MATTEFPTGSSGSITLKDGRTFRYIVQGERTPEVYGWLDGKHTTVKGSAGFWRTADPHEAARRAAASFPCEREA